ncbi:hypothetical protein [Streptomyces candidus]|uniref:Uncharacterized protein n=1 Tax=Streptomyces candidus TaxID=67283 RepID=A0A7X0HDW0_9ACTN|nr:hypothetical protein [Streptomyces candidus]MBB6434704.1 hypothetical protein [Streptomyces candidus]GHH35713.1 hypothetical protein GCM10018773_09480 [Streptomyces candidus]
MGLLRSEGFDKLLEKVATEAGEFTSAGAAVRHLATIGERLTPEVALGALRPGEHHLLGAVEAAGALVDVSAAGDAGGYRFGQLKAGKACLLAPGEVGGADLRVVAGIRWPEGPPDGLEAVCAALAEGAVAEVAAVLDWLSEQGQEYAAGLVARLRFLLRHVGPIRLYIGDACYTNLGKDGNLVGKSIGAESDRCRMKVLAETPLGEWRAVDACFVVCMSALISSGTPSRTEEFSGTQLLPGRLTEFIEGRIRAYDGAVPSPAASGSAVGRLFELADHARELRQRKLESGAVVYRTVQAMTINKKEHLFDTPVTGADVPEAFLGTLADLVPSAPDTVRGGDFAVDWQPLFDSGPSPSQPGFGSRFEEVLHRLVGAAASATGSDVSMSRGPRDILRLSSLLADGSIEPGHWKTSEYYCCVVPGEDFRERLAAAGATAELPQVVRAIAARMRWNGWHFMPHAAAVSDDESFAERDWFFAPSMPDMTEWTSHHHQGHVANGVRHAIRVPFGITLAGAHRPGVYDLRLMRTEGDVYGLRELRSAIAMGEVLRGYYQEHAVRVEKSEEPFVVEDFGNPWYQGRYGTEANAQASTANEKGV